MSEIIFSAIGFAEYIEWQSQDQKTLKKINRLIKSILRDGLMNGEGHPEKMKGGDEYSRHIDEKNRLVYDIAETGSIRILSCRDHYDDK